MNGRRLQRLRQFFRALASKRVSLVAPLALTILLPSVVARADGCDALVANMIRGTGASFAGRDGALAVFRAADAERMSLDCVGRQMVFRSAYREPNRYYFVLIGLAAQTLLGARATGVEDLALRLHQAALANGLPNEGVSGSARLRCETTGPFDILAPGVLCRLEPASPPRRGLSVRHRPG